MLWEVVVIMPTLESSGDKTREGKRKQCAFATFFRGFQCYVEGQNLLNLGVTSAEPSIPALTGTSCLPAIPH